MESKRIKTHESESPIIQNTQTSAIATDWANSDDIFTQPNINQKLLQLKSMISKKSIITGGGY